MPLNYYTWNKLTDCLLELMSFVLWISHIHVWIQGLVTILSHRASVSMWRRGSKTLNEGQGRNHFSYSFSSESRSTSGEKGYGKGLYIWPEDISWYWRRAHRILDIRQPWYFRLELAKDPVVGVAGEDNELFHQLHLKRLASAGTSLSLLHGFPTTPWGTRKVHAAGVRCSAELCNAASFKITKYAREKRLRSDGQECKVGHQHSTSAGEDLRDGKST